MHEPTRRRRASCFLQIGGVPLLHGMLCLSDSVTACYHCLVLSGLLSLGPTMPSPPATLRHVYWVVPCGRSA